MTDEQRAKFESIREAAFYAGYPDAKVEFLCQLVQECDTLLATASAGLKLSRECAALHGYEWNRQVNELEAEVERLKNMLRNHDTDLPPASDSFYGRLCDPPPPVSGVHDVSDLEKVARTLEQEASYYAPLAEGGVDDKNEYAAQILRSLAGRFRGFSPFSGDPPG